MFTIFEDGPGTSSSVRAHRSTLEPADRSLLDGFRDISQISARLHIPAVMLEHAKAIFKVRNLVTAPKGSHSQLVVKLK
jgi:hypothetical protein